MMPAVIVKLLATLAILCSMSLAPVLPVPQAPSVSFADSSLPEGAGTEVEMLACGISA